ncbi:MAG: STAS domain-containing protein [Candidatus Riflebacteria bacterium]|nr:STAS domain-containing protein [Candidatus Riflebacteria bacterium]
MRIKFWGTRGSIPTPEPNMIKYGGDTACVEVRVGKDVIILDAGTGLRKMGASLLTDTEWDGKAHLLLSHTHWDHIQGFPVFAPIFQPGSELKIYGAFRADFRLDECLEGQMSNLYFPVKFRELPSKISFTEMIEETLQIGGARVSARALNHPQGSFGYRIDDGKNVVVYATDTEPLGDQPNTNLLELASGADILILDAQFTPEEYARSKKGWGHSTWKDCVAVATEAQAKTLILFHHDPYHDDDMIDSLVLEARNFFPNTMGAAREQVYLLEAAQAVADAVPGVQATIQVPRDQPIRVSYVERANSIVFHLPEDLSLFNSQKYVQALCSTVKAGHRKIVLNMTRLTHLDSAGVGSLASIYSFSKRQGVPLCMTNINKSIFNVLEVTRFTQLIPTFKTEEEAVA